MCVYIYVVPIYFKILVRIRFLFLFSDRIWKMPSLSFIFSHWQKTAIELLWFSPRKKTCIGLDARLYHQIIRWTDSKMISSFNPVLTENNSRALLLVARVRAGETSLGRQQEACVFGEQQSLGKDYPAFGFWLDPSCAARRIAQISRALQIWHLQAAQWKSVGGLILFISLLIAD